MNTFKFIPFPKEICYLTPRVYLWPSIKSVCNLRLFGLNPSGHNNVTPLVYYPNQVGCLLREVLGLQLQPLVESPSTVQCASELPFYQN